MNNQNEIMVSICCITYNHEKYISTAIESFLMQKTNFPIEIIIHDDASTDETAEIIKKYFDQYPDIIVPILQTKNQLSQGIKPSSTFVWPRAKGKYIAICEGDDYWIDTLKLQKQVDFLEQNSDYIMCYHNSMVVDKDNNLISESKLSMEYQRDFSSLELIQFPWILTLSMVYRNVIKNFPEEFSKIKNGDSFITSMLGNYGKGKYFGDIKAVYRIHENAIWSTLSQQERVFALANTTAWLTRYYFRINKNNNAILVREKYKELLMRLIDLSVNENNEEMFEKAISLINTHNSKIDLNDQETNYIDKLGRKLSLNSFTKWGDHENMEEKSINIDKQPAHDLNEVEYMSCVYIENSVAFYPDDKLLTCCYPGLIGEEGVLFDLSKDEFSPEELKTKKRKIIENRIQGNYGGCVNCPKFVKKTWRNDWEINLSHINLNHVSACNLSCSFCGYVKDRGKYKQTKKEKVIEVIKNLFDSNMLLANTKYFIGNGEPSISKDLDFIINFLLKYPHKIVVQSNGTIYKENYSTAINQNKLELIVTPDAGTRDSYQKIKGEDYFEAVWRNIKEYSTRTNGNITVKVIMQPENVADVDYIVNLLVDSNVKTFIADVDLNIREKIDNNITDSLIKFVRLIDKTNIQLVIGSHWPQEIKDAFNKKRIENLQKSFEEQKDVKNNSEINLENVKKLVEGIPNMTFEQALILKKYIHKNNVRNILELGFAHGVSTLYFSAILENFHGGNVLTIDVNRAKDRKPNIVDLFSNFDFLKTDINVYFEESSYLWRLMKIIEENDKPIFDFCYLDGAHNWYTDGFAFFLVDKLIKKDGIIIFDDMNWTYNASPTMRDSDYVKNLPEEERTTPQISKVFDLLVRQHPSYGNFEVYDNWGVAQKIK